jgi:hypothetical protein
MAWPCRSERGGIPFPRAPLSSGLLLYRGGRNGAREGVWGGEPGSGRVGESRSGDDPSLPGPLEAHHLESLGRLVDPEVVDLFQGFPEFLLLGRAGTGELDVLGGSIPAERWFIRTQSGLVVLRFSLPGTEITVGSNLPEEELLAWMSRLERIELGSELFHKMKQAQTASDAAWEARHNRRNEN